MCFLFDKQRVKTQFLVSNCGLCWRVYRNLLKLKMLCIKKVVESARNLVYFIHTTKISFIVQLLVIKTTSELDVGIEHRKKDVVFTLKKYCIFKMLNI